MTGAERISLKEEDAKPQEIERKFLLPNLPEFLRDVGGVNITQGYLISEPEHELRIRHEGNRYYQTIKTGRPPVRGERNVDITEEQFNDMFPDCTGVVEKERIRVPYGAYTIDIDIFKGELQGLCTAEVEFSDRKSLEEFETPDWFGEEVTTNPGFNNKTLAHQGLPETYRERGVPQFPLDEGITVLTTRINDLMDREHSLPIIVAIAGGSASGKTSAVAARVYEAFGDNAILLSMDNYYKGGRFMREQEDKGNPITWDHPEAVDISLCAEQVVQLKSGRPIDMPVYSFVEGERVDSITIQPKPVIILEGIFALSDEIKQVADIRAFVEIGTHGRIIRRLLRDMERTGQNPDEILKYFSEVVQPLHERYVQSTKQNADIVINNEYNPVTESLRAKNSESQVKYKTEVTLDVLRKLGAERIAFTTQTDTYLSPNDRNLNDTGESIRIREEGDRHILTYKGPNSDSRLRHRPKLEFEIDIETAHAFRKLYGKEAKTVQKGRTYYQVNGFTFSVDEVAVIEKGEQKRLGKFIEFRFSQGQHLEDIVPLLKQMGLSLQDSILTPYNLM